MTTAIAAAVAIVPSTLAGVGIAIATGKAAESIARQPAIATGKAAESIARQPEAAGQIRSSMLIGCALAEATAIYAFITALAILILG